MKNVYISDYTLKSMAAERSHALLFREKVALVKAIDAFGVDALELAQMKNLKEDAVINKTLARTVKNCRLVLPVGHTKEEIEAAYESIRNAHDFCLQVSLPVSTVQMEYIYRQKNAGMIALIANLCACAKNYCQNVEFSAEDATRADPEFLIEACMAAVNSGADAVTLCDDAGECLPSDMARIVSLVKEKISAGVFVRVSDRIGMAAANALAALSAGADGVKTSIFGKDVLSTGLFSDVIYSKGDALGLCCRIDNTEIHTDIGSILRNLKTNSYTEETSGVGSPVLLDGDSDLASVREAVLTLGYDLGEEDLGKVHESIRTICKKKGSVGGKELDAIIASAAMQVPSTYHLDSYTATSGNLTLSVSQVVLMRDGERISGVASGDGPIDAAFKALESCIGYHYELDDFEIQSVTEGREALGSALVKLRHGGKLYSGNGLSTDIVGASIRAYLCALNKIVYENR